MYRLTFLTSSLAACSLMTLAMGCNDDPTSSSSLESDASDHSAASDDAAAEGSSSLGDGGTPRHSGAGPDGGLGAPGDPTFWGDVASIYAERCVACHQEDGIAPFALDTYGSAKTWANAAAAAVESRTMPPWLVTDDGSCNHFQYSRWLSQNEIDTIVTWAQNGAPEGTFVEQPEAAPAPSLDYTAEYQTPEFTPEAQGGEFAEFDEYRCFRVDPKLTKTQFLTGFNVLPGNTSLVHHVLLMPVDPSEVVQEDGTTNGDLMTQYDEESPDVDGWPCFGAAGDGIANQGFPVTWAPGTGVVDYPDGTGVALAEGIQFVIQVHYNMANSADVGASDSTKIQLRLEDEVERPGHFDLPDFFLTSLFEEEPDTLEPGSEDVTYTWELPVQWYLDITGTESLELHGLFPHMHELGRKMDIEVVRGDDQTQCLGDVPRWDFNWQLFYFYDEPIVLRGDDTVRVTCHFDTRGREEPVLPGWGTQNEMCLAGLFLVPR